ncbi:transposable element Tcb1 transposase [Trichonephila clavipes]|nr:transposable element Tcb1 transposase [Trichonephila clavipes]
MFFVNHQIELLRWPARSPDLSPIENLWSMVAQRLTQITSPAATPDQLWQRVEAAWCPPVDRDLRNAYPVFRPSSTEDRTMFGNLTKVLS